MRHLRSLFDLNADDVSAILETASKLKNRLQKGDRTAVLANHVLALIFEKPSLRTRCSFEAAMGQVGGRTMFMSSKDAGLAGRESLADVARVLGSYADAVALRTFSQSLIDDFAEHADCPVINALSDERHPCQALTDIFTIQETFGKLDGQRIVFVGDGNNVAVSLAIAAAQVKLSLTVASPPEYTLDAAFLAELMQKYPEADITQTNDPATAVRDADVVYTDVWASMGQEAEAAERMAAFADYQVNQQLMSLAPAGCKFMHDLPARRGLEVTNEVIDGPASIAFQQAENRMHLAKGLLVWLIKG